MSLLVRSFLSMSPKVLLEVTKGREKFGAAAAVESFTVV